MKQNLQKENNKDYNDRQLTREQTLNICRAHQKLEFEALKKVDKIQDKYIKDEWLVQSAYIADQMKI